MNLSFEEKLAIIKRVCRGYADDIVVRCDVLGTGEWRLTTPIVRDQIKHGIGTQKGPKATRSSRHNSETDRQPSRYDDPIFGVGAEPGAAIEDCWDKLVAAPIVLLMEGSPPRQLAWDGTDFRDI